MFAAAHSRSNAAFILALKATVATYAKARCSEDSFLRLHCRCGFRSYPLQGGYAIPRNPGYPVELRHRLI